MKNKLIDDFLDSRKEGKLTKPPKGVLDELQHILSSSILMNKIENWSISRMVWHYRNQSKYEIPSCKECNSEEVSWNPTKKEYREFCSAACSNKNKNKIKKTEKTFAKNGGHPSRRQKSVEKRIKTNTQRYGAVSPLSSNVVRRKIIDTNIIRYGEENFSKTDQGRERSRRFLTDNPSHLEKMIEARKEKLDCLNYASNYRLSSVQKLSARFSTIEQFKLFLLEQNHIHKKSATEIATQLDIHVSSVCKWFSRLGLELQLHYSSIAENEIAAFLMAHGLNVITKDRKLLDGFELDIVVPECKFAIEYCGLYWHSDVHKTKDYHYEKWKKCKERGYTLLTIFEDEWVNNEKLVKEMILHKLNSSNAPIVYARNTNIREIDCSSARNFLEKYHIQGFSSGSKYLALYDKSNEICAVMVFKNDSNGDGVILNRYATSKRVIGGFSKLLRGYERENQPMYIDTFVDHRWSTGQMYDKTGFVPVYEIPPDYYYVKSGVRMHKFNIRTIIKSEKINRNKYSMNRAAHLLGYQRIYDCGKTKYRKSPHS